MVARRIKRVTKKLALLASSHAAPNRVQKRGQRPDQSECKHICSMPTTPPIATKLRSDARSADPMTMTSLADERSANRIHQVWVLAVVGGIVASHLSSNATKRAG
jgi:hypothetical protein